MDGRMKRKIVFLTGTRADYGKIKSILKLLNNSKKFEVYIYVTGMHMLDYYGNTYREILKDGFKNVYLSDGIELDAQTEENLATIIKDFSQYIKKYKPDLIVVHGDRIEPLAGAIVGAFNNVRVAHLEGGEKSGTIDEHLRHAISKLSQYHFVTDQESKDRLIQMGENDKRIYIIGSPDIDIMLGNDLPNLEYVKKYYNIPFDKFSILMYHPVTTEIINLKQNVKNIVDVLLSNNHNYIVIYPNNDLGSNIIHEEYERLKNNNRFVFYSSLNFERFLTLFKECNYLIGNSSAGINETIVYGIPTINIGSRQRGRYNSLNNKNLISVENDIEEIKEAIFNIEKYRTTPFKRLPQNSCNKFINIISDENFWEFDIQKRFIDKIML